MLKDKPRHGYDVIQELESQFHGFYSPSPGSVYPILQLLEDQGLVTSDQQTGKKVYTITEEGKKYLIDHEDEMKHIRTHMGPPWGVKHGEFMHEIRDEMRNTAHLIFQNAVEGKLKNEETRNRLHEAFTKFRKEIEGIFAEK